jgi:hypothetical protein
MGNRYGQFYGYTALFPIIEETRADSHTEELRGILTRLPSGQGSLFSKTGLVHGARLFIVDDVIYNGMPAREEHLAYSYLALSITFDGELEGLAQRIAAVGAEDFASVFRHCYGFEGATDPQTLLRYLRACQVETTFLYVDVDDVNLEDTLRALAAKQVILDMIERASGRDVATRKALVREVAARLAALEPPAPGAFMSGVPDKSGAA